MWVQKLFLCALLWGIWHFSSEKISPKVMDHFDFWIFENLWLIKLKLIILKLKLSVDQRRRRGPWFRLFWNFTSQTLLSKIIWKCYNLAPNTKVFGFSFFINSTKRQNGHSNKFAINFSHNDQIVWYCGAAVFYKPRMRYLCLH